MTPQRSDGARDAAELNRPTSAVEGVIRLSEVVKGLVSQLAGIDRKLDDAARTEREVANRIASIEIKLAVQETHSKHEAAQRRRTEKLLSRVLWFVVAEITAAVGAVALWYFTKA